MLTPSWLLPVAEHCPEARELFILDPVNASGGLRHLWRDAFQTGVLAMSDTANAHRYLSSHRAVLAALTPKLAMAVTEGVANHFEEVRKGGIPFVHNFAIGLDMDIDGVSPAKHEPAIGARVDCCWQEHRNDGTTTAVVLMHDLWETDDILGDAFWPDLGTLTAGLMWAAKNDVERMRVGRLVHRIGKPVRYQWSEVMGDREMQLILARAKRAMTNSRVANVGRHCTECPALRACASWQLPVLYNAHTALRPLQRGEHVTKQNIEHVRTIAYAMKKAAEVAEAQIKAFEETQVAS